MRAAQLAIDARDASRPYLMRFPERHRDVVRQLLRAYDTSVTEQNARPGKPPPPEVASAPTLDSSAFPPSAHPQSVR
jgi:hypothetical protein